MTDKGTGYTTNWVICTKLTKATTFGNIARLADSIFSWQLTTLINDSLVNSNERKCVLAISKADI